MPAHLHARAMSAGYGAVPVVHDLDLELQPGEIVALLGANGAGKSTTLFTLSGLLKPLGGELDWKGAPARGSLHQRCRDGLAYVTDVKAIEEPERSRLLGLDTLVLNALWWRPHPTHLSIGEAVATAQLLGARRTFLTHLTHETGYAALAAQLPSGVYPAYDGLVVEVP